MTGLDVFALLVLFVLLVAVVAVWVALGMLPGRIARARNHPQADAINVCGWWGVLTMGILLPLVVGLAYALEQGNRVDDLQILAEIYLHRFRHVHAVAPPFIISRDQIDTIVRVLDESIGVVEKALGY